MTDHLFQGLVLCATGLEPHVQEQVRKLVVACGGAFELDLVLDSTTHLIAETAGSQKHRVALAHGLPVASPRWVFDSFRAHRLLEINKFALRALEGLVVCTTGLSDDSRGQVEQLTTLHGGVYDPNLEVGYTNVLIAQRPGGAKYEAAVQHGVPVVHISWLFACVERGVLAPEDEFVLEKVLQPSRIYRQLADDVDDVMLVLPALVHECNLRDQVANYKEDGDELHPSSLGDLPTCFERSNGDGDDGEWTDLFDSSVFYLVGFPPRLQDSLQRIIRRGMGTIYYDLMLFQVTHVVVSPSLRDMATLRSIEDRIAAANADATVYFISAKWIVDSLKCCRLEPEELYPVEIDDEHYHPDLLQAATEPAASTTTRSNNALDNANAGAVDMGGGDEGDPAVDTVEHAEQPVGDPSALEEEDRATKKSSKFLRGYAFLVLCLNPDDSHLIKPMVEVIKKRGGAEAIALDYRDFGLLEPAQFGFLTHAVICSGVAIDEEEVLRIQSKFDEFHRSAEAEQDELVEAPPSKQPRHEYGHPHRRRRRKGALTFVSDLWLNCSLAKGEKLPYQSHELFAATLHQPRSLFPVALPLRCFRGVRASVSVYYDVDRLVVEELLRVAGARVTDNLKKDRNTHLICQKPIGRKFIMAEQWGLTIVTARWVVESIIQGKLLDASREEYQVRDDYDTGRGPGASMSQDTDASGPNTQ